MNSKLSRILRNPATVYLWACSRGLTNWVPSERHLKLLGRAITGEALDLDCPESFNEKMQWLKLHDHNPVYTQIVDKYRAKQWVADRIGAEYLPETYAVWNRAADISIDTLPNRFVLKTNHDSGGVVACSDKATFDLEAARRTLDLHMHRNYYWNCREWPYKNVKPLVFAEEYLETEPGTELADYKLFRFTDGRIVTLVCEERNLGPGMKKTFFDEAWRPLPVSEGGHPTNPDATRPLHFSKMKELAHVLAADFPFCRVDFYDLPHRLIFGELTLYPNAGFENFTPPSVNEEWGRLIDISTVLDVRHP